MIEDISMDLYRTVCGFQKNEITEFYIYKMLADKELDENRKQILLKIANDEKKHYDFWMYFSKKKFNPSYFKILKFKVLSAIRGEIFCLKLMERAEQHAQVLYSDMLMNIPDAKKVLNDENEHELQLIELLKAYKLVKKFKL